MLIEFQGRSYPFPKTLRMPQHAPKFRFLGLSGFRRLSDTTKIVLLETDLSFYLMRNILFLDFGSHFGQLLIGVEFSSGLALWCILVL